MKNLSVKLLAVTITLILYVFVNSQSNRTDLNLTLPLEFKNLPADKYILLPTDRSAEVSLRGPSHLVQAAASANLTFEVILPDGLENNYEFTLTPDNLDISSSIEAYNIKPSRFDLVLADKVSKNISIDVPMLGKINENFKIISLVTEPAEITLSGPDTEVNEISSTMTLPLDVRNITESGTIELTVRNPGSFTEIEPNVVQVVFDVASLAQEKQFDSVAVELRSGEFGGYTIEPDHVSIELSGPKNIIKKMRAKDLNPFIKIEKVYTSPQSLPVRLDLPEFVSAIKIEPNKIRVSPISNGDNK